MARRFFSIVLSLFLLGAGAASLRAEIVIFVFFGNGTAPFNGESFAPSRTNWVEVTSCNFGFNNESLPGPGGAESTVFSRVTLSKRVDRVTPGIFASLVAATGISTTSSTGAHVTIDFTNRINGTTYEMLFRVELKNVIFNSLTSKADLGETLIVEDVALSMGSVRLTPYVGGVAGTQRSWSVLTNTATF